jgi:hypothetical protein
VCAGTLICGPRARSCRCSRRNSCTGSSGTASWDNVAFPCLVWMQNKRLAGGPPDRNCALPGDLVPRHKVGKLCSLRVPDLGGVWEVARRTTNLPVRLHSMRTHRAPHTGSRLHLQSTGMSFPPWVFGLQTRGILISRPALILTLGTRASLNPRRSVGNPAALLLARIHGLAVFQVGLEPSHDALPPVAMVERGLWSAGKTFVP